MSGSLFPGFPQFNELQRRHLLAPILRAVGSAPLCLSPQRLIRLPLPAERDSREHEEPTTSEMAEETYSPKIFRPKHTRISELKAEAVKKDRRKKLTQSKFVGGAENTAHPRVISAPEMRQESEQVSLLQSLPSASASHPAASVTTLTFDLSLSKRANMAAGGT